MCVLQRRVATCACVIIILRWTSTCSSEVEVESTAVVIEPCDPPNPDEKWSLDCLYLKDGHAKKYNNIVSVGKKYCPIGFESTQVDDQLMCYRRKEKESFSDFYDNCSNNGFSLELYSRLHIDKSKAVWSEYRTAYPGGPFVDTRITDHLYQRLNSAYKVINLNQILDLEKDFCIVIDPAQRYVAVDCEEKHYRYCFVKPIVVDDVQVNKNCEDLKDSLSVSSPVPACLTAVAIDAYVSMYDRVLAENSCKNLKLSILSSGWLYANHPWFNHKNYLMRMPSSDSLYRTSSDMVSISSKPHKLTYLIYNESQSEFSVVICERRILPKKEDLKLNLSRGDEVIINTSFNDLEHINCFSDGPTGLPVKVNRNDFSFTSGLSLKPKGVLYLWCIYRNPITYHIEKSNELLNIGRDLSLRNIYAVKLKIISNIDYDFTNLSWKGGRKLVADLVDYIRHENINHVHIDVDIDLVEKNNQEFYDILYNQPAYIVRGHMTLKRRYLDDTMALYHIRLPQAIKAVKPGAWRSIKVLHMRPVYYCETFKTEYGDTVLEKELGVTVPVGCVNYSCAGNFNEGVQWNMSILVDCKEPSKLQRITKEVLRIVNGSVPLENIEPFIGEVNEVLGEKKKLKDPGRLLYLLDQLGTSVTLNNSQTVSKIVKSNIALLVAESSPKRPILGLKISAQKSVGFINESLEILENLTDVAMYPNTNEMEVIFPADLSESVVRVSFVIFRNDHFFYSSSTNHNYPIVNSHVISITAQNITRLKAGDEITIYFKPIKTQILRNQTRTCAYWHFVEGDEKTGYWSQDGCSFTPATLPGRLDVCRCNHLTHFAQIIIWKSMFSEKNEAALEIISVVGCCSSILGLIMVVATAAMFRTWRREFSNKIWLQLSISMILMSICFLIVVYTKFDHYNVGCMLTGIVLHYSVLCSFCWMVVAAVVSYRKLVLVLNVDPPRKLLRACVFSYGVPCVVIGVLLCVAPRSYGIHFVDKAPSGLFCYPTGLSLWLSVYTPIAVMVLVNWTLYALIVRSVHMSTMIERHGGDSKEMLRSASVNFSLVFMFGLPWVAGLFAYNVVAAYLYTMTATFQGFVLFILFIFGKPQTRNMWLNRIKSNRKASVAYSTNSKVCIIDRKIYDRTRT